MRRALLKKYQKAQESYDTRVIEDILENEECRIVSLFKEYLIWDEVCDLNRRVYSAREAKE